VLTTATDFDALRSPAAFVKPGSNPQVLMDVGTMRDPSDLRDKSGVVWEIRSVDYASV